MRKIPLVPLVLLALLLVVPATAAVAPAGTRASRTLADALEARLARAELREGRYGIAVLTRGPTPCVVFARGHTVALRPASVAKVFTAAAALDLLGPCHYFTTCVSARGEVSAQGVLDGDLVVHGTGDPNLSGRFHDGPTTFVLDRLARAVRQAGIRRVSGALVLDDGAFDRTWFHPSWSEADRGRWYGAPVAGLAFNDSCVDIVVQGAKRAGQPARVTAPSTMGVWSLDSRVDTVAKSRPAVGGLWVRGGHALRVRGRIGKGVSYPFSHPVPEPLAFFGGVFHRAFERAGVTFQGGVRAATDAHDRRPGRVLVGHRTDLQRTLEVMNRRSQNFYAGMVFKAAGAALEGRGTWSSGRRAVAYTLRRRGLDPQERTRIVDGSGLSRDNRATAATVVRLLHSFDQDLLRGPRLFGSLAVPGQEGTLRRRLVRGDLPKRLHAKTGTLGRTGVHALAGYLDGRGGEAGYVFAILLDGVPGGRALIDDLVVAMAAR